MAPPLTLPFVTEAAYAARLGLAQEAMFPGVAVAGAAPNVFPADDLAHYGGAPLAYDAPTVTRTRLRNAAIRGGSNLVTAPEAILRHGLLDLARDRHPDEFAGRLILSEDGRMAAWAEIDPFDVAYVPEAAAFTDGLASNYAHWLTEVLPRLAALMTDPAARRLPLLLDARLHRNIMRSVAMIAGDAADVRPVAAEHLVRAGVLHNVSATGYVPFKLREQPLETIGHGVFSPGALRHLVAELKRAAGVAPPGGDRPKLLIRRNSTIRQMENEAELQAGLERRGFVVVAPETLSFDEQVALYSKAGMIVGATGAAMANLVFCQPDCPVVVMMMKFRHTAVWYWRRMAAAAGAGPVFHVSGAQVDPSPDPWEPMAAHRDYRVEAKDVLDAVDAAEAARAAL